jgi:hypothetical protein
MFIALEPTTSSRAVGARCDFHCFVRQLDQRIRTIIFHISGHMAHLTERMICGSEAINISLLRSKGALIVPNSSDLLTCPWKPLFTIAF